MKEEKPAGDRCGQCGALRGAAALPGEACPVCLLGQGLEQGVDVHWVRDRFPQLEGAEEVEPGADGGARWFEARDFESGAAVLLTLWRREPGEGDRELARLGRRADLAHPRIARVLDYGEMAPWLYAVLERPEGQRLRDAVGRAEVSRGRCCAWCRGLRRWCGSRRSREWGWGRSRKRCFGQRKVG